MADLRFLRRDGLSAAIGETTSQREIWLTIAPQPGEPSLPAQLVSIYRQMRDFLAELNLSDHVIVQERIFTADPAGARNIALACRSQYFPQLSQIAPLAGLTIIGQAPGDKNRLIESQFHCLSYPDPAPEVLVDYQNEFTTRVIPPGPGRLSEIYLMNVIEPRPETPGAMFALAGAALARHGFSFADVVRTWIYLPDIAADYAQLNRVRNAFFERQNLTSLPASTGIGGRHPRPDTRWFLDLYAVRGLPPGSIAPMHTETLNEAPEYGARFSRGMALRQPERTLLYLSGTASIDEKGQTAHMGDIAAQLERTLLNLERLLRNQDVGWERLVLATCYLKHAAFLPLFWDSWRRRGLERVPVNLTQCPICRPELLCEIEAVAFI